MLIALGDAGIAFSVRLLQDRFNIERFALASVGLSDRDLKQFAQSIRVNDFGGII